MSRRGGRRQKNAQILRVVCTDEGRHKPRLLAEVEFRYGAQVKPEEGPDNPDGTYSRIHARVDTATRRFGADGDYASTEDGLVKGLRMRCPSCPRDMVLKSETIESMFREAGRAGRTRPDYLRSTSTVDVSTGASLA